MRFETELGQFLRHFLPTHEFNHYAEGEQDKIKKIVSQTINHQKLQNFVNHQTI